MTELLRIEGVTKAYPGVVANSDVSFTIKAGEVHADKRQYPNPVNRIGVFFVGLDIRGSIKPA